VVSRLPVSRINSLSHSIEEAADLSNIKIPANNADYAG
jgi:hypothetical protein